MHTARSCTLQIRGGAKHLGRHLVTGKKSYKGPMKTHGFNTYAGARRGCFDLYKETHRCTHEGRNQHNHALPSKQLHGAKSKNISKILLPFTVMVKVGKSYYK